MAKALSLAGEAGVRIVPTLKGFHNRVDTEIARQKHSLTVNVKADTDPASREMAAWRAKERHNAVHVPVKADFKSFRGDLSRVEHVFKRSSASDALRLQVKVIGLDALPALAYAAGSAASGLDALGKSAFALPGLLAGALASVGALAVGLHGIGDALKAYGDDAADSAQNARKARDADRDLARSKRDLRDAIRDQRREIEDLNSEMRRASLNEADALLNVQEAIDRLREGGFKSVTEFQRANLNLYNSVDRLNEVRKGTARTAEDVSKANIEGVEGSDRVADALDRVAAATENLNDTKITKLSTAMAKLSPNAKATVEAIHGLSGAWTELQHSVSDALLSDLDKSITDLGTKGLPTLKAGLTNVATGLNANFKQITSSLGDSKNLSFMERIFGNTEGGLKNVAKGMEPLISGFLRLSDVSASFLPRLGDAFNKVSTRFNDFVTAAAEDGRLEKWIDQGLTALTSLGNSFLYIGSIISSVSEAFNAASGTTGGFIGSLERGTKSLAEFVKSAEGQNTLVSYFQKAKMFVGGILDFFRAIKPVLSDVVDTAREWSLGFLSVIGVLADLAGWVEKNTGLVKYLVSTYLLFKTAKPLVEGLTTSWKNYGKVVNALGRYGPTEGMFAGQARGLKKFRSELSAVTGVATGAASPLQLSAKAIQNVNKQSFAALQPANNLTKKFGTLQTAAMNATGSIGGTGKAGLMGALGGLASFLGPTAGLMVAVGGFMALTNELGEAHRNAAKDADTQRAALDQLKSSLDSVSGSATQATLLQTAKSGQAYSIPGLGTRNISQDVTRTGTGITYQELVGNTNPINQAGRDDNLKELDKATRDKIAGSDLWKRYEPLYREHNISLDDLAKAANGDEQAKAKVEAARKQMIDPTGKGMVPSWVPGAGLANQSFESSRVAGGFAVPDLTQTVKDTGAYDSASSAAFLRDSARTNVTTGTGTRQANETVFGRARLNAAGAALLGKYGVGAEAVQFSGDGSTAQVETDREPTIDPELGTVTKLSEGRWKIELTGPATAANIEKYAAGGVVRGKGSGTSDSNLAMLSRGEHVTRKKAVDHYGQGFFDDLNSMSLPKFDQGGPVLTPGALGAISPVTAPKPSLGQELLDTFTGDDVKRELAARGMGEASELGVGGGWKSLAMQALRPFHSKPPPFKIDGKVNLSRTEGASSGIGTKLNGRIMQSKTLQKIGRHATEGGENQGLDDLLLNFLPGFSTGTDGWFGGVPVPAPARPAAPAPRPATPAPGVPSILNRQPLPPLPLPKQPADLSRIPGFNRTPATLPDAVGIQPAHPTSAFGSSSFPSRGYTGVGLGGVLNNIKDAFTTYDGSPTPIKPLGKPGKRGLGDLGRTTRKSRDFSNVFKPGKPPLPSLRSALGMPETPAPKAPTLPKVPTPGEGSTPISPPKPPPSPNFETTQQYKERTGYQTGVGPTRGPEAGSPSSPSSAPVSHGGGTAGAHSAPGPSAAPSAYAMPNSALNTNRVALPGAPRTGSEAGLQRNSILTKRAIEAAFPQIGTIGGFREDPNYPDEHPAGKAIDVMTYADMATGDAVKDYAMQNAAAFGVEYAIWNGQMWYPDGSSKPYTGPNPHTDHVHLHTSGGGYPDGTEQYSAPGMLPGGQFAANGGSSILNGILGQAGMPSGLPGSGQTGGANGLPEHLQPKAVNDFLSGMAQDVGSSLLQIGMGFFSGMTGLDFSSLIGAGQEIGNFYLGGKGGGGGASGGTALNDEAQANLDAYANNGLPTSLTPEMLTSMGIDPSTLGLSGTGASAGGGAEQWRPTVRKVLQQVAGNYGITNLKAWEDDIVGQIDLESSGNPGAQNLSDSNGNGGAQQVFGLGQFLPSTFAAHNKTGGDISDPVAQIYAMIDYLASPKYGVIPGGGVNWKGQGYKNGKGYKSGGQIRGPGSGTSDSILARVSRGEYLNSAGAVAHYGPELFSRLNAMQIPRESLPGFEGGMQWLPNMPAPAPAVTPTPAPAPASGGQATGPLPLPPPTAPPVGPSVGAMGATDSAPSTGGAAGPGATAPAPAPSALPQVEDALAGIGSGIGMAGGAQGLDQPGAAPSNGNDNRGILGAAPTSQNHNNPAFSAAIEGGIGHIGSIAAQAASMAGSAGAMGMDGGTGGAAAGAAIQAGAQIASKVASGAVNILSSLAVGNITGGSTAEASGVPLLPQRAPMQTGVPAMGGASPTVNNTYNLTDLDAYSRTQKRLDAQNINPYLSKF